jgi:DNA-binding transcriptional ArsR family regulator
MVFEGVAVTLLILMVFLMLAMLIGGNGGTEYANVSNLNGYQYTYVGQDNTLYMLSENSILAIDSHGDQAWNFTVPAQWAICTRWVYSPPASMIETGYIGDSGPIINSDNGIVYVYLMPQRDNFSINEPEIMAGELIAISPEGDVLWSLPLDCQKAPAYSTTVSNGLAGDVSLTTSNGQIYAFHDYNETVIDAKNGTILWNVTNVSDPGSVDEEGYLYIVRSGGMDIDPNANYYRQFVADYRSPSGVIDAYYSNGSLYWQKDMGEQLSRQYTSDPSLPSYHGGLIYAPTNNGVTALYRNGTVKWTIFFAPDEFKFNQTDPHADFNVTYGVLSFYSMMPFDPQGNLYLQYMSGFIDGERQLCLIVLGPDGNQISSTLMDADTYQAADNGIGYTYESNSTSGAYNVADLKNDTLYAYDIKSGNEIWQYSFNATASVVTTLDQGNIGINTVIPPTPESSLSTPMYYASVNTGLPPTVESYITISAYPANGMVYVEFQSIQYDNPVILGKSRYAYSGGIYALDETGTLIWYKPIPPTAESLQVMPGGTIFYTTEDGRLGVTGTGIAAGFTVTAALYIFFRVFVVGAVARARSRLNKNENRNRIFEFVKKNPGSTVYEISRGMGMNMGTLRYHMLVLGLNHKIAASHLDGKYIRYFTNAGSYSPEEQLIVSLLKRDAIGKVMTLIYTKPGISNIEMARELGMQESVVFRRAKELVDRGIVVKNMNGRESAYFINEKCKETVARLIEHVQIQKIGNKISF